MDPEAVSKSGSEDTPNDKAKKEENDRAAKSEYLMHDLVTSVPEHLSSTEQHVNYINTPVV